MLPESWRSALVEGLGRQKTTADGNGLFVDADTMHANGNVNSETGELPDVDIEPPALESGSAEETHQSRGSRRT